MTSVFSYQEMYSDCKSMMNTFQFDNTKVVDNKF